MSGIFLSIFELSGSAIWLILAILAVRPFLRKIPKWGMVLPWGLVGLRLLVPFSIESRFSLLPGAKTAESVAIMDFTELPAAAQVPAAADVDILPLFSALWFVGAVFLVVHFAIRYWRILKKLNTAVLLRENIYQSEWISAPVVIGLMKPKIVVPFSADETSMKHITAHEKTHIHRGDHLWKLLAYGILTLHWFNPLVWVAYMLLGRDIELACDEAVIRTLNADGRADYTQALVTCAVGKRTHRLPLLGFGTVGVRTRVKSVLHYRQASTWSHILLGVVMVLLGVCFMTDPVMAAEEQPHQDESTLLREEPTEGTTDLIPAESKEQEIRAELEKLEIQAELEKKKAQLAFYQECLDRDLKAYFQTEEKYQDAYVMSIAFYRSMVKDLSNSIIHLENLLSEME